MKNEYLSKKIDIIDIPKEIKELLNQNEVITIEDLCSKTKTDLKNMRLSFSEINKIQVEVQLLGLNLQKCEWKQDGVMMTNIENMTNKELFEFVENYIADKIVENKKIVRYTYYELKVKLNLSEKELNRFLRCSKIILEELNYQVFFTGARFKFENADRIVETNEFLIGIKDEENESNKWIK